MDNPRVCQIFRDIAQLLEIKGDNPFRIRAYERAAQNIEGLAQDLETYIKNDTLTDIPGIGRDLSDKIKEFARTGKIKYYEELKKTVPPGLLDLMNVPSIGPKTAKLLYDQLEIKSIADLEKAISQKKLAGLFGIKQKSIENILKGIELFKSAKGRMNLARATEIADTFIAALQQASEVKTITAAGSLRRQKETVRDIDLLVKSRAPQKVMDKFTTLSLVKQIQAKGETKSSVLTREDVQVDCRVVDQKSFGAALVYFTGSKNFNIKLRKLAIKKGLKVNEYGIFKREKFLCGKTEEEVFKILGLAYVEPELREDTGEIELALKNQLPQLIAGKDLKGDLHAHSLWSDGNNSIAEMAQQALELGYSYIAITDHSQSLKVARGLKPSDLKKKKLEIDRLNSKLKNLRILYGTEVDIKSDGKIDYPDDLLKGFDIVVAAIHSGFKQSRQQLTKRLVLACKNKYVHIIAHPTGRLRGARDAYELDFEELFKVCKDTNTHLELNAFPDRLDLDSLHCRRAKEAGVKLAIGTDAHLKEQLAFARFGISIARRGWLGRGDVINTLPLEQLLNAIKK